MSLSKYVIKYCCIGTFICFKFKFIETENEEKDVIDQGDEVKKDKKKEFTKTLRSSIIS